MDFDAVITSLETEYRAGLEDFEDLAARLPPIPPSVLEKYAGNSDFTVVLLLSVIESKPELTVLPQLLSPDRERSVLERVCRMVNRWYPREVLELGVSLMFGEGGNERKAGFTIFGETWPEAETSEVREVAYHCLERLRRDRGKGDKEEIVGVCVKAVCEGLKKEEISVISSELSHISAEIEAVNGSSAHYLPFYSLFALHPELQTQYHDRLVRLASADLTSNSPQARTAAVAWLRKLVADSAEDWWDCFFDMYLALENYSRHLVQSIWEDRMPALLQPARERWISILLRRVRAHENPSVKKHILKLVMKTELIVQFPSLILNEVVELIGDSSIFADAPRHAGFSRFATTIPSFFHRFLCSISPQSQQYAIQTFISSIAAYIQHQSGFFNAILTFKGLKPACGEYLDTICVRKMRETMKVHFTNITPVQRKGIYEVFGEMLKYRTFDCDLEAVIELLSQFPADFLPKAPIFRISDVQSLILSAIEAHSKGVSHKLHASWIVMTLSLTENWEKDVFLPIIHGPMRYFEVIYSNTYLKNTQIQACFWYVSCVFRLSAEKLSPPSFKLYQSLLRNSASQLVSYLLLQAGNFVDPDSDLSDVFQPAKVCLKAVLTALDTQESFAVVTRLLENAGMIEGKGGFQAVGLLTLAYTALKSVPKSARIHESVFCAIATLHRFNERAAIEGRLAKEITVLKWKLVRAGFSERVMLLVREDLGELLDVSSSAMKKTAFRLLQRSLHTSYLPYSSQFSPSPIHTSILTGFQLVQECKLDLSVRLLRAYYKFALSPTLFQQSAYHPVLQTLIRDLLAIGRERWQFVRGVALHLLAALRTDPSLVSEFVEAIGELAVGMELRGTDSDIYFQDLYAVLGLQRDGRVPKNDSEMGHFSRFVTLTFIDGMRKGEWVQNLATIFSEELGQKEAKKVDMPNSPALKRKIAIGQLLLTLAPYFPYEDAKFVSKIVSLWLKVLQTAVSSSVRHYLEKLVIHSGCQNYAAVVPFLYSNLRDTNCKAQFGASVLFIAGAMLLHCKDADDDRLVALITPFMISNTAVLRRTAHFVIMKWSESNRAQAENELQRLIGFLYANSECKRMRGSLQQEFTDFDQIPEVGLSSVLTGQMNEFGSFLPDPLLDRIDRITADLMSETRIEDFSLRIDEFWLLEASKFTLAQSSLNYQRKVTQTAAIESSQKGAHTRHPIILLASFIESPLTLAGLTRSCEVFAARQLVYSDERLIATLEYKQMSVTAEKWLPMVRVDLSQVADYVKRRKAGGYTVFALRTAPQTDSVNPIIPTAAILIPVENGVEIPTEIAALVDESLYLPLNPGGEVGLSAHIAASLWVWEYTKQNFL